MSKSQGGPPRQARDNGGAPIPQGMSTQPQRVVSGKIHTTEGEVTFGRGVFQTQVLPTGMHLLRFVDNDDTEMTFVLGGQVYGYELDPAKVEELEIVS